MSTHDDGTITDGSIIQRATRKIKDRLEEHADQVDEELEGLLDTMTSGGAAGTGPLFWGWSLDVDEDGTPSVSTHGNLRQRFQQLASEPQAPFVDWYIDEKRGAVVLTAEVPDATPEDLTVTVDGRTVTIESEGDAEEASLTLPLDLVPETAQARLDGDQLSVDVERKPPASTEPVVIPVEEKRSAREKSA